MDRYSYYAFNDPMVDWLINEQKNNTKEREKKDKWMILIMIEQTVWEKWLEMI